MPRMVVVWCPDWPVTAAGAPPDSLTAVVHANRVVACSEAARAEGVRPGLRRREAQSRCPELELLAHDPARDARAFEPVLTAVEQLTPWVEVLQPGECAFPARGAARYHGGEPALTVTVTAAVHAAIQGRGGPGDRRGGPPVGRGGCRVGIADGTFAAGLAARHQLIVPPGASRTFLAPHPVTTLDRPDLADLLVRLGLRTLGDLAALPTPDLATRFGPEGARAARLASGLDEHPKGARRPPPDLRVTAELDPPADRVDIAAFTAKTLADDLVARLDHLGLSCTRLRIEAETDQGETLSRVWRHDPTPLLSHPLSSSPDPVPRSPGPGSGGSRSPGFADPPARMAAVMAERVRWQLDGWLTGRAGHPPGALTRLTLVPDEVVPAQGRQLGFWGGESEPTRRAARALARIQGLLGPEAVQTAHLQGGRDPATRVTLTPGTAPGDPVGPAAAEGSESVGAGSGVGDPGSARTASPGSGSEGIGSGDRGAGTAGAGSEDKGTASGGSGEDRGAGSRVGRSRGIRAGAGELPTRSGPAPSPPAASPLDPAASSGAPASPLDPAASGPPASPLDPPRSASGPRLSLSDLLALSPPDPPAPSDPGLAGLSGPRSGAVPWPGRVPAPAPAIVYAEPVPAEVVDATGATVAVDGRGLLGSFPSRVRVRDRAWSVITAWAGPWLVDERWWDPAAHRRLVRLQATTDQGAAYLLRLTGGRWWVEAIYD
jgi:protein ImuB